MNKSLFFSWIIFVALVASLAGHIFVSKEDQSPDQILRQFGHASSRAPGAYSQRYSARYSQVTHGAASPTTVSG